MTHQCHCAADIPSDRYACTECTTALGADLDRAASHLDHIDDKRARRGSRLWIGGSSPNAETALPYDERVGRTLKPIRNAITTWARLIIHEHQCRNLPARADRRRAERARHAIEAWDAVSHLTPDEHTRYVSAFRQTLVDDLAAVAASADLEDLSAVTRWLAAHREWAATRPWIADLCSDALDARTSLDTLMDTPPERYPLGECGHDPGDGPCTHPLLATAGDATTTCRRCGWTHDVEQRRLAALKASDDMVVTVKESARLLRLAGLHVDTRDIYATIRHFRITPALTVKVPGTTKPSHVYRLGQIREAVEACSRDDDTRRAIAKLKRGA